MARPTQGSREEKLCSRNARRPRHAPPPFPRRPLMLRALGDIDTEIDLATKSWAICSQRRTSPLNRTSVVGRAWPASSASRTAFWRSAQSAISTAVLTSPCSTSVNSSAGSRRSLAARASALSRPARNRDPALRRPAFFVMGVLGIFAGGLAASSSVNNQSKITTWHQLWLEQLVKNPASGRHNSLVARPSGNRRDREFLHKLRVQERALQARARKSDVSTREATGRLVSRPARGQMR